MEVEGEFGFMCYFLSNWSLCEEKKIQIHGHVAFYVFIRHYFECGEFYQLY